MAHSSTEPGGGLVRTLGLFALVAFGVGDILGSGVYALTGKVSASVGTGAWLSYVIAGVVAALTGLTYAEFIARMPKAGGAAHFVDSTFRIPFLTFLVIFFVTMSGLFSVATASRTLANYAQPLWENAPAWFGAYVVPLVYICVVGCVVARGIAFSSMTNAVCAVIEVSALLFIIAVAVPFFFGVDHLQFNEPSEKLLVPGTPGLLMQGAALAFFAFVGFEDMANLAEETKDPERTVPRALCMAIAITSLIYCLVVFAVTSVLPPEGFGSKTAPVDAVAKAAPWFPIKIYAVIPAFAVFNTGMMNLLMASRLLYGMARGENRQLPAVLSRLHPTWRTPVVALVVVCLITMALVCSGKDVSALAGGTTSFLLIVFALLHAGLVKQKLSGGEAPKFRIPLAVPILGAVTCTALMFSRSVEDYKIAGTMAAIAVALFLVNWFVFKHRVVEAVD